MKTIKLFVCLAYTGIFTFSQKNYDLAPLDYPKYVVERLCSPAMEGRGYVASGCQKAAHFIQNEFQALGLLPYHGKTAQSFNLSVNTFPRRCKVRMDGKPQKPGIDFLVNPSSSAFSGTLKVLSLNASEILQYPFGKNLHPGYIISFIPTKGMSVDTLKLVKLKLEKLARIEIPVIEFTNEKLTWSVSSETFKYPYIQSVVTLNALPKAITLKIDTEYKENVEVENLLGYLPSKTPSDSLIILCAHYDHLGRMGKRTYFPGGNDNASGVAMMLQLTRKLKKEPLNNHNVLFIAFAGEEIGLVGSHLFLNSGALDRSKVSMVLNLDIMGSGEEGITVVNGSVFPAFFERIVNINQTYGLLPAVKPRGKAANSDHYAFSQAGIPALFIYTMGVNKNYHDIYDTFNALSFSAFTSIETLLISFLKTF
ncbi:MAG: M28 family metallopeptidase [Flavobacteriales bacterium]